MAKGLEKKNGGFRHNIIAICYDFDGTLSPHNMQEGTIFKEYGIDSRGFWAEVNRMAKDEGYDKTLCYLNKLIYDPEFRKKPLTEAMLTAMADKIEYFPGVESFFPYINRFVKEASQDGEPEILLEHYIISSGMRAVLNGVNIKQHFKEIYACEYEYNSDGSPKCVKMAINDTNKTQFLFRINKGLLRLDQDINGHMDENERRIPFQNMIYIGDGYSDVPGMAVTVKNGGYAIAVYSKEAAAYDKCVELREAERVHHIALADFGKDSELVGIIKLTLMTIIQKIRFDYSVYRQKGT